MNQATTEIALIGLAVIGQNLALNIDDKGYAIAVYNRTTAVTGDFLQGLAKDTRIAGYYDIAELVSSLKRPRRIILLVRAGPAVDAVIAQLAPLLGQNDIII